MDTELGALVAQVGADDFHQFLYPGGALAAGGLERVLRWLVPSLAGCSPGPILDELDASVLESRLRHGVSSGW
jgi:hypothetical protein